MAHRAVQGQSPRRSKLLSRLVAVLVTAPLVQASPYIIVIPPELLSRTGEPYDNAVVKGFLQTLR
jgi:hypothetical protein